MNKIKQFLRDIFAPQIHYHSYNSSSKGEITPEDWEAIGKDFEQVGKDMNIAFKNFEKRFKK